MKVLDKVICSDRVEYRLNGLRHREDGPALIKSDGTEMWYLHGLHHREDGPATIWEDGSRWWYRHGMLHREDGPAIVWKSGSELWYIRGVHLKDGDAGIANRIVSGSYPFDGLPLLINHPVLKYFALRRLGRDG